MRKKNNIFVGTALLLTGLGVLPIAFCHGKEKPSTEYDKNPIVTNMTNRTLGYDATRTKNTVTFTSTNGEEAAREIMKQPADRTNNSDSLHLQKHDVPAQEWSANHGENNQYTNNQYNNNQSSNSANYTSQTVRRCSPEAYDVGIKHYHYDEAKPQDLVKIGSRKIHRDAKLPLLNMKAAAKRDGVTLTVGSAYRSFNYQQGIINRKKGRHMSPLKIYSASAPAEHSEHSTGYVVDFTPINSSFGHSEAYKWLLDNAGQYGWEQSFTETAAQRDHVMVEPWHWRFIGTQEAKALFHSRKECP